MRVLCLDESLRHAAELPPEFHWSNVAEHPVDDARLGAAVVRDADDLRRLRHALNRPVFDALPLVGLSSELRDKVDVVVGSGVSTIGGALTVLRSSIERATRLPAIFAEVDDDALRLLAYLAVRDAALVPVYTPDCPPVAYFPVQARLGDRIEFDADRLAARGLLTAQFDERINVCPACASSRLIVRELCPACHSGQIANESIIHHFRCAEQGPESQFRRGTNLVCPKCRQYLRHFSVDYDKPGMVVSCANCGHLTGEPEVGFRCLDCGRKDLADRLGSREVRSYSVTEDGRTNIFDESWLSDFVGSETPPARSSVQNTVMTMAGSRSDAALVEVRFAQNQDSDLRWRRPRTQNHSDQATREFVRRLIREHFADDPIELIDVPDGFDALVTRSIAAVKNQLPELEERIKQFVVAPASCTVRTDRSQPAGPSAQHEAQ